MSWIEEKKRNWRMVIFILLILAFLSPWGYERLNIPAEYDCGPINTRLEGDFCGSPISGAQLFLIGMIGIANGINGLITREGILALVEFDFWLGLVYGLVLILLILPIVNTLFLYFSGDKPRLQKFHLLVCGLDLFLVLLVEILSLAEITIPPWGILLYTGTLICILILEGVLPKRRKTDQHI